MAEKVINISDLRELDKLLKGVVRTIKKLENEGNEYRADRKRKFGLTIVARMKLIAEQTRRKRL